MSSPDRSSDESVATFVSVLCTHRIVVIEGEHYVVLGEIPGIGPILVWFMPPAD